jgi:hypothetical protein
VRRLAWALAGLAVGLHLLAHLFVVLGIGVGTPLDDELTLENVGHYVAFFAFPVVGGLVASRRPENAIGWLFIAIGISSGITLLCAAYADYAAFADRASLPAGAWVAWVAAAFDVVFFVAIDVLVLIFPSGRPPSRRWTFVLASLLAGGFLLAVNALLKPGEVFEPLPIENPAGIGGAKPYLDVVEAVGALLLLPAAVITYLGALWRFWHARGAERQQFKWFALAACFLLISFLAATVPGTGAVSMAMIGFAFASVPLSVGIAVLRYRLYDIDRVISRTVVYGSLTLILGAAYAGLVLAGQALFSSFAGGSNLAIAGSTLVVAALFLPLRARLQRFVDRRFYRRRYDAQRTLDAFGSRLREHVELDGLRTDLEGVVAETMQPTHVSLWLREARS